MGETGCGKTHLIRFMCKFAAYGGILMHEIKEIKRRKLSELDEVNIERKIKQIQNMIILKVCFIEDVSHNSELLIPSSIYYAM